MFPRISFVLAILLTGCQAGAIILDGDGDTLEDGAISVTPDSVDWGVVFVGQTYSEVIQVTNVGKRSTDVSLELLGDALGEYVLSPYTSAPEAGETADHTLTLSPTARSASVICWRACGRVIDARNGKSSTVSPSGTVSDGNLNSDTVSENNRNSAKHRLEQCSVYCQTPFHAQYSPSSRGQPLKALHRRKREQAPYQRTPGAKRVSDH